jgi:hypothetical protein
MVNVLTGGVVGAHADGMLVTNLMLSGSGGVASDPALTVLVPGAGSEIVSVGAPETAGVPPV